jgi:hypothetical protein
MTMPYDHIVEEMRQVKERIAAEYGYNLRKLAKSLREEQEQGGRRILRIQRTERPQS